MISAQLKLYPGTLDFMKNQLTHSLYEIVAHGGPCQRDGPILSVTRREARQVRDLRRRKDIEVESGVVVLDPEDSCWRTPHESRGSLSPCQSTRNVMHYFRFVIVTFILYLLIF